MGKRRVAGIGRFRKGKKHKANASSPNKENLEPENIAQDRRDLTAALKREKLQKAKITGFTKMAVEYRQLQAKAGRDAKLCIKQHSDLQASHEKISVLKADVITLTSEKRKAEKESKKQEPRANKFKFQLSSLRRQVTTKRWYDNKVRLQKLQDIRRDETLLNQSESILNCIISLVCTGCAPRVRNSNAHFTLSNKSCYLQVSHRCYHLTLCHSETREEAEIQLWDPDAARMEVIQGACDG